MLKLFSWKTKNTRVVQGAVIDELAAKICAASVAEANSVIVRNANIPKGKAIAISQLFCQGLIQLTDRIAYTTIPSTKRAEVMDRLMFVAAAYLIKEYAGDNYSREEISDIVNKCVNENNQMLLYLGQFKKFTSDSDDDLPGNFFWEFGKVFAEKIGHKDDAEFATLAAESLMNLFEDLNAKSILASI